MQKIILYYKFTPLSDPEAVKLWQKAVAAACHVTGRILLSPHGINGTLGGDSDALKAYIKATKSYAPFKGIEFKWSDGSAADFPRLNVKVRDEIVTFAAASELQVDENGVVDGGTHLKPAEVHELVAKRGDEVVFFDGRSTYEAAIGKFRNAVVPNVRTAKDFIPELESGKYDNLKNKPIVTYCTGGVRCEVLTSLMKHRGFKEVYQLDGGIVKYGEQFQDGGLWDGSLYVFDGRMGVTFSDAAKDIGECVHCAAKTSHYENCENVTCNDLILVCHSCASQAENRYCTSCQTVTKTE